MNNQNDNMDNSLIETKLDKELKELEDIGNNQFYLYLILDRIDDIREKHIWESLHNKILPHFEMFSKELETFFSKYRTVSGFDTEGGDTPYLAMGITISGPKEFKIWGRFPNNPSFFTRDDTVLLKCQEELKNINHPLIGFDIMGGQEYLLLRFANVPIYDARTIFKNCDYDHKTSGIHYAEQKIGFKRQACEFFKHKYIYRDFSIKNRVIFLVNQTQIYHSLWNHYRGAHQRICNLCSKSQDFLLYCLEDALSAAFIYIYYKNRYPEKILSGYYDKKSYEKKLHELWDNSFKNMNLILEGKLIYDQFISKKITYREYYDNFLNLINKAGEQIHKSFNFFQSRPGIIEFKCDHCELSLFLYGNMPAMKVENYLNLESYNKEKFAKFLPALQEFYSFQTKRLE